MNYHVRTMRKTVVTTVPTVSGGVLLHACGTLPHHMMSISMPPLTSQLLVLVLLLLLQASEGGCCASEGYCGLVLLFLRCRRHRRYRHRRCLCVNRQALFLDDGESPVDGWQLNCSVVANMAAYCATAPAS